MSSMQIYFGYQWDKGYSNSTVPENLPAQVVFKKTEEDVALGKKEDSEQNWMQRLRTSTGASLCHILFERLSVCDITVLDIAQINSNVWMEVGTTLAVKRTMNEHLKIFLLKENPELKFKQPMSSEFYGYFLSYYEFSKHNDTLFKNRNSFLNSMRFDITKLSKYFNQLDILQVEGVVN